MPDTHAVTPPVMPSPSHRSPRALALIQELRLAPHPEGGWYREVFRSSATVQPADTRSARSGLTTIDFLLEAGQFSAWHRVLSDEVWHLLEGRSLTLWLLPPMQESGADRTGALQAQSVVLSAATTRRRVVPAGWWQAAEIGTETGVETGAETGEKTGVQAAADPSAHFAYVGATVAPGFEFIDFAFGRDDPALCQHLAAHSPALQRLL